MKQKIFGVLFFLSWFIVVIAFYASQNNVELLNPKGVIASSQRNYILLPFLLSTVVVIPVMYMLISFAIKYRDTGAKKRINYQPDWDSNKKLEIIWWGIPIVIIGILSVATWQGTHQLDPKKPINSSQKPLEIKVAALEWKWLFIYPEENIATVNYMAIPKDRPIKLSLTSDGPMNSFWVPQLAGQIYAMDGMETTLNMQANKTGEYRGMSSNLSGEGFSDMIFTVNSSSPEQYDNWVKKVKMDPAKLDAQTYETLRAKSVQKTPLYYGNLESSIYDTILHKHTMSHGGEQKMTQHSEMKH